MNMKASCLTSSEVLTHMRVFNFRSQLSIVKCLSIIILHYVACTIRQKVDIICQISLKPYLRIFFVITCI